MPAVSYQSTLIVILILLFNLKTTVANSNDSQPDFNQSTETVTLGAQSWPRDGRIYGWISQPNYRGTMDIIWSCLVTIFISTYTILCLNIPSKNDKWYVIYGRRLMWMGLAILGPEFVLTFAAGQWSRAQQSVAAFHAQGYKQWTLRQGFFADMGGFILNTPDTKPFPLNAKQLHWLVVHKFIDVPTISKAEISDKSKQDKLAKIITTFQIGFLILQTLGRVAQNLAITTLELNALAIVVCSVMTSLTWLSKPTDVHTPVELHTSHSIKTIIGPRDWKITPLDFVDENGPGWAINVQAFMKMPTIPPERPIQRIPNDRFPMDPYGWQEYFLCFATLIFAAIHVSGWNFAFPSKLEQILWRSASMLLFGITALFWILETMASWKRLGRWKWLYYCITNRRKLWEPEQAVEQDTDEYREPKVLPLPWEFWSILPLVILYGVARFYLIVEAFLELRNLPATALLDVDWSLYFPHIS